MANNNQNPKTPELKPLPKPVRLGVRKNRPAAISNEPDRKSVAQRLNPPPPPINPDDFDLDKPRRSLRKPQEPTLGQAFMFFFRRTGKNIQRNTASRKQGRPVQGQNRANSNSQKRKPPAKRVPYARLAGILALALIFITLVVFAIISAFSKNAIAIYLEEEVIGYIAMSRDIDEATVQAQAVSRLETSLGALVKVDQTVSIQPARASNKNIQPYSDIIDQISRGFTYKIAAVGIYVDGVEIVLLRNQAEADMVAERLFSAYTNENTVSSEFNEDWECRVKLADQEDLGTIEDALIKLDKKTRVMEDYEIRSGDTLSGIALNNNTTIDKICQDNPPMTTSTILKPGNKIKLETTKPFLSIRTVDEIVRTEKIPIQTEQVENPLEHVNYHKVIEEGREGEKETRVRINRINGVQQGQEEIIGTSITTPSVNKIIEVGTSSTQPERR